jgi:hypothetical protein
MEESTAVPTTNNDTLGGNNMTRRDKKEESLQGWTIEANLNSEVVHTSQSRRSSIESSVLLDEVDHDKETGPNNDDAGYEDDDDDDEFSHYNLETAVRAWDQIGALTQEITSSLMAKQASVLCERFRRKTWPLMYQPATKKRRMDLGASTSSADDRNVVLPSSAVVVVSDEETASHHDVGSIEEEERGLPDDLSSQVDRIGRMSKLVMEIEYCQQALRREMIAMSNKF